MLGKCLFITIVSILSNYSLYGGRLSLPCYATSHSLELSLVLISLIFSYKLYSVATPKHPAPLLLENHVRIVALRPDLQRVSFYSVTDFLNHSSTTELIPSRMLIKGSYPTSEASLPCRKSISALWLLCRHHCPHAVCQRWCS